MRLSDERYENIKKNVVKFIKNTGIDTYPLNLFDLCNKLKIPLVPYSSLTVEERLFVESKTKDAYVVKDKLNIPKGIVYNDEANVGRIPTNFGHELGHIGMGHKEHSELADIEADFFAVYLLTPNPIIEKYDIESFEDICDIFNVSYEVAYHSFNRYRGWKRGLKHRGYLDYEIDLLNYIKNYNNIKNTI